MNLEYQNHDLDPGGVDRDLPDMRNLRTYEWNAYNLPWGAGGRQGKAQTLTPIGIRCYG